MAQYPTRPRQLKPNLYATAPSGADCIEWYGGCRCCGNRLTFKIMAFDTSTLDQQRAEKRRQWENERQVVLAQLFHVLRQLSARFTWDAVYVFGSLAQPGRFRPDSDLDVAVSGMPDADFFPFAAALTREMARDADVIMLEQCHFAAKIRREGILWTPSD